MGIGGQGLDSSLGDLFALSFGFARQDNGLAWGSEVESSRGMRWVACDALRPELTFREVSHASKLGYSVDLGRAPVGRGNPPENDATEAF